MPIECSMISENKSPWPNILIVIKHKTSNNNRLIIFLLTAFNKARRPTIENKLLENTAILSIKLP